MKIALPLVMTLTMAACTTVTPEQRAAAQATQAQMNEQALSLMAPAMSACLDYAEGWVANVASLTNQGFSPSTSFGRTAYKQGDVYALVNSNTQKCRVSWRNASRIGPVGTALTSVMSSNGYTRGAPAGNEAQFSDGTRTIGVTTTFVQTSAIRQWDVVFSR